MKKAVIWIIIFSALCGCFYGCAPKHEDWQVIELGNCGTIKIPPEWQCFTEDGLIYILDEELNPIMIERAPFCDPQSNKYYSNFFYTDSVATASFSNSTICGEMIVVHEGYEKEMLFLTTNGPNLTWKEFIVWDESLSMDELKEIAKTFVINQA